MDVGLQAELDNKLGLSWAKLSLSWAKLSLSWGQGLPESLTGNCWGQG